MSVVGHFDIIAIFLKIMSITPCYTFDIPYTHLYTCRFIRFLFIHHQPPSLPSASHSISVCRNTIVVPGVLRLSSTYPCIQLFILQTLCLSNARPLQESPAMRTRKTISVTWTKGAKQQDIVWLPDCPLVDSVVKIIMEFSSCIIMFTETQSVPTYVDCMNSSLSAAGAYNTSHTRELTLCHSTIIAAHNHNDIGYRARGLGCRADSRFCSTLPYTGCHLRHWKRISLCVCQLLYISRIISFLETEYLAPNSSDTLWRTLRVLF